MRHGRNLYLISRCADEGGAQGIEFEAWGREDAVLRAEALAPRNQPFMLSRNGRPVATATISDDGVWTCVPAEEC